MSRDCCRTKRTHIFAIIREKMQSQFALKPRPIDPEFLMKESIQ